MKNITQFINESSLEDILDEVENWFWDNCGEDGYDSPRRRREEFEAMAAGGNDMMVDICIDSLDLSNADADKYYDDIVNKLIELTSEELENL